MKILFPLILSSLAFFALSACQPQTAPAKEVPQPQGVPTSADKTLASPAPKPEANVDKAKTPEAKTPKSTWRKRPPSQIRKEGNHLRDVGSVYLKQHAFNPLEWYPWGEEALNRARLEDKPIFLSIGYSSCHWCHVMEHEVFAHDEVAEFMNENFVCIKVDREERPDLDAIYMDAVLSLNGRGGWPMTVLLTPSLKPFFGGTYFPKARFMGIAKNALKRFKSERNEVETDGDRIYSKIAAMPEPSSRAKISESALRSISTRAVSAFDTTWGGLRGRMKFPSPSRWRYLVHAYRKWGNEEVAQGVRRTLDMMASGGIHDQLGGGFHRYTVEKTWLIPHFEKMLYDNGQLASLYLEAASAFQEPRYVDVARHTLDFLLKEMTNPSGGFYGSFDADSGGEEGTFYVWSPDDIRRVVGLRDSMALCALLGVSDRGNFEHGKSVLTRRVEPAKAAKGTGTSEKEMAVLFDKWKPKLYEVRAKRIWPGLDKKIVTGWNGLAISGFSKGYVATGDERYRTAAVKAVEYLWRVHRRDEGGLYRASNEDKAGERAILDDYAFLAVGLVDLFEATGDSKMLERAKILVKEAEERFARPGGGWFLAESKDETLLMRHFETYDSVRPSGNSSLLEAQLRIAALTGDESRFQKVDKTISAYAALISRSGLGMGGWASAALRESGPFYEVVIAGDPQKPKTKALLKTYRDLSPPWAVQVQIPASGADKVLSQALPSVMDKKGKQNGDPMAYVCVRGTCKKPTSTPSEFQAQLMDGWKH